MQRHLSHLLDGDLVCWPVYDFHTSTTLPCQCCIHSLAVQKTVLSPYKCRQLCVEQDWTRTSVISIYGNYIQYSIRFRATCIDELAPPTAVVTILQLDLGLGL